MNELKIEFNDTLTPSSCSKLVIKIIKHILYNSQQIPVNYELLSQFMKRGKWLMESRGEENGVVPLNSYKKMLVEKFFTNVLRVYNDFEETFKNLELEFSEGDGLKEIIIMIGSTTIMPKKVFRIEIPTILKDCNCINGNSLQKNLTCVFKCMINSEYLHSYFKDNIGPMNVYILIKRISVNQPKSKWLLPKENFRIPNTKQLIIKLKQPVNRGCACTIPNKEKNIEDCSSGSDSTSGYTSWYQQKINLKGFKEQKVDGISAFNFFKA